MSAFSPWIARYLAKQREFFHSRFFGTRAELTCVPQKFNAVQSATFRMVSSTDSNMVVSAPTGCGKTVILELAILRMAQQRHSASKVIYIAPTKSLCQERYDDWCSKFSPLNLRCLQLTGDTLHDSRMPSEISQADIICTTPEKWDACTRRWTENRELTAQVALILIDEVHILNDTRGPTLEAVVSRMRVVAASKFVVERGLPASRLRILAVSAAIPNVLDLGRWLGAPAEGVFQFGDEYRSVPLTTHVIGYDKSRSKNDFLFEKNLMYRVFNVLFSYSAGKPTLAKSRMPYSFFIRSQKHWQELARLSQEADDKSLQGCLAVGIGFHTAGMSAKDRVLAEDCFRAGLLGVLVCTSTLAQGVNLPAHLVIIKSTRAYQGQSKGYAEMSQSVLLQMVGRAGRPQYDSFGVAVIMTTSEMKPRYEQLTQGMEQVESHLSDNMLEILNSEIVLETINSIDDALRWIQSTFFFARAQQSPEKYGFPPRTSVDQLLQRLHGTISQQIQVLFQNQLATAVSPVMLKATRAGQIMSQYYLKSGTMKSFLQLLDKPPRVQSVIECLATAEEFSSVVLRRDEKRPLNEIATMTGKYSSKKARVKTAQDKIFALLQGHIGRHKFEKNWSLTREMLSVADTSRRLATALIAYLAYKQSCTLEPAILARKCIQQRLWFDTSRPVLQLTGVGDVMAERLSSAGLTTIQAVALSSAHQINAAVGKASTAAFGAAVQQEARGMRKLSMEVEQRPGAVSTEVHIEIRDVLGPSVQPAAVQEKPAVAGNDLMTAVLHFQEEDFKWLHPNLAGEAEPAERKPTGPRMGQKYSLIVLFTDGTGQAGTLLHYRRMVDPTTLSVIVPHQPLAARSVNSILIALVNNDAVGFDSKTVLPLQALSHIRAIVPLAAPAARRTVVKRSEPTKGSFDLGLGLDLIPDVGGDRQLAEGRVPCKHQCQDKQKCKHVCCKEGVPAKRRRVAAPKKTDEAPLPPQRVAAPTPRQTPFQQPDTSDIWAVFPPARPIQTQQHRAPPSITPIGHRVAVMDGNMDPLIDSVFRSRSTAVHLPQPQQAKPAREAPGDLSADVLDFDSVFF